MQNVPRKDGCIDNDATWRVSECLQGELSRSPACPGLDEFDCEHGAHVIRWNARRGQAKLKGQVA